MATVVVPRIAGAVAYDPTSVAITGGTSLWNDGLVGAPSIAFASEPTTGFYRKSAGFLAVVVGGAEKAAAVGGGWIVNGNVQMVSSGTLSWASGAYDGAADTTLARGSAGVIKFASANSFSANGSVATVLGSVGPTGSHTTVQKWLTIQDNGATVGYIPVF